jgi:hypothetical protein
LARETRDTLTVAMFTITIEGVGGNHGLAGELAD